MIFEAFISKYFLKKKLTIKYHILSTSRDSLSTLSFQSYSKSQEHVHTFAINFCTCLRTTKLFSSGQMFFEFFKISQRITQG